MNDDERELIERIESLRETLFAWTAELVAIPTVNPYSGDDSAGSEAVGLDWFADRCRAMGASVRRVPVPPDVYERGGMIGPRDRSWEGRDNVVAGWTLGTGDGPCILLNDHMDTVGTAGMEFDPFDPVIRDGRMYGRGTSDTKGCLATGLAAVQALREDAGLNGRVVFECVVDEECNGGGAGTLACCLAGVKGDVAICLDGYSGALHVGCHGVATARVIARGRAGHAARGGSVNAIDKGIAVKLALDAFAEEHRKAYPDCPVNLGIFRSGTLPAIVPDQAELQANMVYHVRDAERSEAGGQRWGGSVFCARVEHALSHLAESDPWFVEKPAEVEWIKDLYPFTSDPSHPFIQAAVAAASDVAGEPVPARVLPAWFDAAHLARKLGVPTIGMGSAADGTAHTASEYVILEDLVKGAKTVALTMRRILAAT